ncbi:MAG TPA: hypothetical protein VL993_10870 [Stellaceae bacterium]|nr:hypothetical protein [Stellaceae bacterium]
MARKIATATRARPRRGFDWTAGLAVLAIAIAVAALPLFMILLAGLVPTAVAALIDRHPGRYLIRTVAPVNLAGTVLPALTLFETGFGLSGGLHVLADPRNWLVMYGAAAVGWGLHWAMPQIARVVLDVMASQAEQRLRRRADQLVAEWGADVSSEGPAQPPK